MAGGFYTVPEACERLKIGRSLLYRLFKTGEIVPCKFGSRATRIAARELERYEEAQYKAALDRRGLEVER
jgi:excisionase family DNA binding protein